MYNMVLFYQPDTRYNVESLYANCTPRNEQGFRLHAPGSLN
jgi:hypothetical protein